MQEQEIVINGTFKIIEQQVSDFHDGIAARVAEFNHLEESPLYDADGVPKPNIQHMEDRQNEIDQQTIDAASVRTDLAAAREEASVAKVAAEDRNLKTISFSEAIQRQQEIYDRLMQEEADGLQRETDYHNATNYDLQEVKRLRAGIQDAIECINACDDWKDATRTALDCMERLLKG